MQLARALGDRGLVAEKLATSGYAYEQVGNFRRAAAQYQAALGTYRDVNDARGEWRAWMIWAAWRCNKATPPRRSRYQDALKVAQRAGLRAEQVSALEHTAATYRSAKDYAKATQYYQQALKLPRRPSCANMSGWC